MAIQNVKASANEQDQASPSKRTEPEQNGRDHRNTKTENRQCVRVDTKPNRRTSNRFQQIDVPSFDF
jgi:hypothetical protein